MTVSMISKAANTLREHGGSSEGAARRSVIADMLDDFVGRLRELQGANLLQVVLYGSVARGDDTAESDVDLFILLRRDDEAARLGISALCSDVTFDHSWRGCGAIKLSPITMSLDEYRAEGRRSLLFYHIREEGVDIWL